MDFDKTQHTTDENVIRRRVWKLRFEAGEVSARLATPSPLSGFVAFGQDRSQQQQQLTPELVGAPATGALSRMFDVSRSRSHALHTLRRRVAATISTSSTCSGAGSAVASAAASSSSSRGAPASGAVASSQSAAEIEILVKAKRRIKKERKKLKALSHCSFAIAR